MSPGRYSRGGASQGAHHRLQPDGFYQAPHNAKIRAMVNDVVAKEGPVAVKPVIERVASACGLKRIVSKINHRVRRLAQDRSRRASENGPVFLWPHAYSPFGRSGFRVNPNNQKPQRLAGIICTRGIKKLAAYLQDAGCPLDEQRLLKGMAEAGRKAMAGQDIRLADIPAEAGQGVGIFECLHDFTDAAFLADHPIRQAY